MKKIITYLIALAACITLSFGQTKNLTVEPNHSSVGFEVPIAGGVSVVTGKFMDFDLKLNLVNGNWEESDVTFSINVTSINTGIDDRDGHLQSADFFDAVQFPDITFESKRIKATGENLYEMEGVFTMHGVSKTMNIPFEVVSEDGNTIGIKLSTVINRLDHGVGKGWQHSSIPNFLGADIKVNIYFWTKRDKRVSSNN